MRDFLSFFLIEPFTNEPDLLDILFGLLAWAVFIGVTYGLFVFIDWLFGGESVELVKVVGRDYIPGHFQTIVVSSGKSTTTSVVWIPDAWYLNVSYLQETLSCSVSEHMHNTVANGTVMQAELTSGFFTSDYYCDGVIK